MGLGLAAAINRVTSGTVALSFLSLQSGLSPAGAFGMFGSIALGVALFIAKFVPETGGRSLEQIERDCTSGAPRDPHSLVS